MKKYIIVMLVLLLGISSSVTVNAQHREPTVLGKIAHVTGEILRGWSYQYSYYNTYGYYNNPYYNNYSYYNTYSYPVFRHRTFVRYGVSYCRPICNNSNYQHYYYRAPQRNYQVQLYEYQDQPAISNEYIECPYTGKLHTRYALNQYGDIVNYCRLKNCSNPHYVNRAYLGAPKVSNPYGW